MTLRFEVKRGDTAPTFRAQCLDGTDPVNLTAAPTVRFLMKTSAGVSVVAANMTKDDQTTLPGWVRYAWDSDDLAAAGTYLAEVEVTWADGKIQTFPRDEHVYVLVAEDLG
jgi:hypothetical protein